jgi:CHAT domain-containing protein/tetratricopeptide (TPR) repeat protein
MIGLGLLPRQPLAQSLGGLPKAEGGIALLASLRKVYYQGFKTNQEAEINGFIAQATKAEKELPPNSAAQVEAIAYRGMSEYALGQVAQALETERRALQTASQVPLALSDSLLFRIHLTLGDLYWQKAEDSSAFAHYQRAQDLALLYPKIHKASSLYNSMAGYYYRQNNLELASRYFNQAKTALVSATLSQQKKQETRSVINNNLAGILFEQKKYREALAANLENLTTSPEQNLLWVAATLNVTSCYYELGQLDSSKSYLEKLAAARPVYEKTPYLGIVLRNLAENYNKMNQFAQAKTYLDEAEQVAQALGSQRAVASTLLLRSKWHQAQGQLPEALRQAQRAIVTLHREFKNEDPAAQPPLRNLRAPTVMLEALQRKAQLQNAAQQPAAALATYQVCLALIDTVRQGFDQEANRVSFTNQVYSVYEEAIVTALQQKQPELAFHFTELSKANALRLGLQSSKARQLVNLGAEEAKQRQQIAKLQEALVVASQKKEAAAITDSLNGQLLTAERGYQQFIRELEAKNPRYYRFKYAQRLATLAQARACLPDAQTAILEYFLGEKNLFVFAVTAKQLVVKTIPLEAEFSRQAEALSGLMASLRNRYNAATYRQQARYWYDKLVLPVEETLTQANITRLVLVPDGPLHKVPFDALLKPDGRYLLYKFATSRAYSTTLFCEAVQAGRGDKGSLFAPRSGLRRSDSLFVVAPFARGDTRFTVSITRDSLENLPSTREEAEGIGQLYGSLYTLSVDRALKENFLRAYRRFGVIHLSTHAEADDNDPLASYVAFYPRENDSLRVWRLYTPEIYELEMNEVQLVVLSACETGDGEVLKGEGILSLARAFTYAGCPNLIMTLWNANDLAAKNINLALYRHLKDGLPKDVALQRAKMAFLDTNGTNTSPYLWGNFVLVGEPGPLFADGGNGWWWAAAGLLMLGLLAGWWWWRRG